MANTYTQIHIQAVFAVQNRVSLLDKSWRGRLYQYMIAIIQNHDHKVLSIGGTEDHVHILFGQRPTHKTSDLIMQVKRDSSEWINENNFVSGRFNWQEGYGAFSHDKFRIPVLVKYIENQEKHHKKRSFREEYIEILKKLGIDYNPKYMFHDID